MYDVNIDEGQVGTMEDGTRVCGLNNIHDADNVENEASKYACDNEVQVLQSTYKYRRTVF